MVEVYAIVLLAGIVGLLGWILFHAHAVSEGKPRLDPEQRFGIPGRRVVAGMVGFGMAGMSAEFSPQDLAWPLALALAVAGGAASVWWSAKGFGEVEG